MKILKIFLKIGNFQKSGFFRGGQTFLSFLFSKKREIHSKETILRKSEYQQKVLKFKKTSPFSQNLFNWKQVFEWKYSPIGHYFSFKKISQWKDIKIIDIIHFRYKLKWRISKMWGEKIKFVCKLLFCLLPEHSQK